MRCVIAGDEKVSEIGVPSRPAPSAATGLKPSDLKIAGGSVGKANAYIAAKIVRMHTQTGEDRRGLRTCVLSLNCMCDGRRKMLPRTWKE